MVAPDAARAVVATTYERRYAAWAVIRSDSPESDRDLASLDGTPGLLVDLPLHPPTEATALRDPQAVAAWIAAWRTADPDAESGVVWDARRWASMGTQLVPARLRLGTPEQVARFAGRLRHWHTAHARATLLLRSLVPADAEAGTSTDTMADAATSGPVAVADTSTATDAEVMSAAVQRTLRAVVGLDAADVQRLVGVLTWLVAHPKSGLFVRQLPIRGVDTKWIEQHRSIVTTLFAAATGTDDLGLATKPGLLRARFLDAGLAPGGVTDVSAPVADLARVQVAPQHVIVVENLETLLALPALPGCVAIHGKGYAVGLLNQIPWLRDADVVYWGDLDTDGLNILAMTRAKLPQTRSILMDRATVEEYADLCVPDPKPKRTFAGPLTPGELDAVAALREAGDMRLEQERIPWHAALSALCHALERRPRPAGGL